ncbi:MAG TPA: hypothetical protein VFX04_07460, partial [Rhodanobacteraceae bacterium]|nr:hypothetical protein [Rhodanobacteraceae bacterium]
MTFSLAARDDANRKHIARGRRFGMEIAPPGSVGSSSLARLRAWYHGHGQHPGRRDSTPADARSG